MSTLSVAVAIATSGFSLDVAFDAPSGVTVLFGPSGSGKSTTLACIAGIVTPERGRIALGDDVFFDHGSKTTLAIHERRVAYVFQSLALFPHMTALQNVAYGVREKDADDRARSMLERMRVPHLADRRPATFSGGEAQRVALARAFAMKPRVLLLDEPFSALDSTVKTRLLDEVREIVATEKLPTLLVTHHPEEARALGERVVRIDKGRVVETGSVGDARLSGHERAAPRASDDPSQR